MGIATHIDRHTSFLLQHVFADCVRLGGLGRHMFKEAEFLYVRAIIHHTCKVARLEAMMAESQSQGPWDHEQELQHLARIRWVARP